MAPPRPDLRRRAVAIAAAVATIALGLASRRYAEALPDFIAAYAGDTLWALVVYLIATALVPSTSILRRALAALAFAFAIEASQLYHAPWIEEIRANRLAALVLGSGFLWSDLACYAVGVALGAAGEALASRPMRRVSQP
jgi:hypothetical protein